MNKDNKINKSDRNFDENNLNGEPIGYIVDGKYAGDSCAELTCEQREHEPRPHRLNKTVSALLAVAVAASVGLVCFFFFLCSGSRDAPKIFDARQIGATDSSVLISWSSSGRADGFRIRLIGNDGEEIVSDCDLPFAALRNLHSNTEYSVDICALSDGDEYGAQNISCRTDSYCEVTNIKATSAGGDCVNVSWEYNGVNNGFEAVAYALDSNAKRHLTSKKVRISADGDTKCKISGLASELNYTVVVMPLTSYCKVGKSTFKTGQYSKGYDKINIIRFVICSANVENSIQVQDLNKVKASSKYKASLIINGKTDKNHKANISLLITDSEGNLVSEEKCGDIYTNPEGKDWFYHRPYLFEFTTPDNPGNYYMYLVIDGKSASRINFAVDN